MGTACPPPPLFSSMLLVSSDSRWSLSLETVRYFVFVFVSSELPVQCNQEHLWTLERNLDAEPACLRLLDEAQAGHNQYHSMPSNTIQLHPIPSNTMQFHPGHIQFNPISSNIIQYQAGHNSMRDLSDKQQCTMSLEVKT